MWIYYHCVHGPGHQGTDDGFKYFDDNYDMKDVKEYISDMFYSYEYPIFRFWEVDKPLADSINNKIEDTKDRIKNLKRYLKILEETDKFDPQEEKGEDPILKKNLSRTIEDDLLERLHKAGFYYDSKDLSNWYWGKKKLLEPIRSKVLSIMRRSKKYPSVKEQL